MAGVMIVMLPCIITYEVHTTMLCLCTMYLACALFIGKGKRTLDNLITLMHVNLVLIMAHIHLQFSTGVGVYLLIL